MIQYVFDNFPPQGIILIPVSNQFVMILIIETGGPVLVSSIDIEDILDTVTYDHLDDVYIRLGLEYKDIQNERLGTPDRRGQERKILHMWRNTADERATRKRIIAAMKKVSSCRAGMHKLIEKWNNPSQAGKHDI